MALADDVALRIPSQVLIELTNPRDPTATSSNSTLLAQAASSIAAYFGTYARETYDGTVAIHLEVAVKGVVGLLQLWASGDYGGAADFWDRFKGECETVAATRANARLVPNSSSALTPSEENPTGAPLRPWADDRHFDGLHTDRVRRSDRVDFNDD